MIITKVDNFRIYFETKDSNISRKLGGIATSKNGTLYWVPITLIKLEEMIDFMDDNGFDPSELIKASHDIEYEYFQSQSNIYPIHDEILRDYQNLVVERIESTPSFGVFLEQRLGKTPTTIVSTRDYDKVVVSVPNGLQVSWKKSWKQFGGRDAIILKGNPTRRAKIYKEFEKSEKCVLIGSVDTLSSDAKKTIFDSKYDYLIVDEAHYLRNNTLKTKGTLKLASLAKHKLALTGTPATNKPEDIIPIILFLYPKSYTKWGLIEYFFNTRKGRFALEINGVKSEKYKEWVQFLNRFSIIMKAKDHMEWFKEPIREEVYLEMGAKQLKAYKQMEEKFKVNKDDGGVLRAENVLTQLGKLVQIALDPNIVGAEGESVKTKWIKNWIKDDDNKNEHLVVWSYSKEYLNRLYKDLEEFDPIIITGDTKMSDRQALVDKFQSGKKRILLAGIQVLNAGYTLDKATTMMFANRSWSATENEQANFRLVPTKKGNVTPKTIIDIKIENSIDDYVEMAYKNKLSMTEIVNNFHKYLK